MVGHSRKLLLVCPGRRRKRWATSGGAGSCLPQSPAPPCSPALSYLSRVEAVPATGPSSGERAAHVASLERGSAGSGAVCGWR